MFKTIHDMYDVIQYGRPGLMITTFFYCNIIDNVKSIPLLMIVYCVVVRRFMHLEINENELIDPSIEKIPKQEN